jgi:hypothetical protein
VVAAAEAGLDVSQTKTAHKKDDHHGQAAPSYALHPQQPGLTHLE